MFRNRIRAAKQYQHVWKPASARRCLPSYHVVCERLENLRPAYLRHTFIRNRARPIPNPLRNWAPMESSSEPFLSQLAPSHASITPFFSPAASPATFTISGMLRHPIAAARSEVVPRHLWWRQTCRPISKRLGRLGKDALSDGTECLGLGSDGQHS